MSLTTHHRKFYAEILTSSPPDWIKPSHVSIYLKDFSWQTNTLKSYKCLSFKICFRFLSTFWPSVLCIRGIKLLWPFQKPVDLHTWNLWAVSWKIFFTIQNYGVLFTTTSITPNILLKTPFPLDEYIMVLQVPFFQAKANFKRKSKSYHTLIPLLEGRRNSWALFFSVWMK